MADSKRKIEDDAQLLEGDEVTHASQESPSGDRHENQSNMEKFEELSGNFKDGFSLSCQL
jgi:anti-sigma28 factor (negative regulator of flagellin synthesis)